MTNIKKIPRPELIPEEKKPKYKLRTLRQRLTDAKNAIPKKQLIGGLISEGEQVILFGGINAGKSLFAYQIAQAIAEGEDLTFKNSENEIRFRNECEPQKVLSLDFEHSDDQIKHRISLDNLKLSAGDNIISLEEDFETDTDFDNPDEAFEWIKGAAEEAQAKVIIIDNISAMSGDLEKAENAKRFMKSLRKLCRVDGYTVIILAHTPKLSSKRGILRKENIAGSNKLPALADSVIGIAEQETSEGGFSYIKHLKRRTGAIEYGIGKVLCSKIADVDGTVQHVITHTANELDVISDGNEGQAKFDLLKRSAVAYLKEKNLRAAGEKLNVSKDTVSKRLNKLKEIDPELFGVMEKMNPLELDEYGKSLENPTNDLPF